ncbi:hypothetical protein KXD40_003201 [Peronospora effusa]|nr:hypothetical protein KXD40_003201 [Peronospora effusa]
MTRTGIGVVATRPIPAGGGVYGRIAPTGHESTPLVRQRGECGSVARFVEHSCTPSTHFHEVRGRRRVVVSLVAQSDIASGTEVIVDYTGQTNSALWFHCQCALHQNENRDALRATAMKKEVEPATTINICVETVIEWRTCKSALPDRTSRSHVVPCSLTRRRNAICQTGRSVPRPSDHRLPP